MELASENYLGDRVNVVAKVLVEQKSFRHLKVVQVLQESLQLIFEYRVELLSPLILQVHFAQLFDAVDEEFQFFEKMVQHLDVLVVYRLVQQVVQAKPTRDDEHKTLIELCCNIKECLVIIL